MPVECCSTHPYGCVKETDRFGGGGVIVWGGISHVGKTNLEIVVGNLNGIRYRDEILAPIVLPFGSATKRNTLKT
jgi:hypothetical protein